MGVHDQVARPSWGLFEPGYAGFYIRARTALRLAADAAG